MGIFFLAVETTVRDVMGLLELHKVHPQVRRDVRRRLNILIDKSHEDMRALEPGYEESSEQVCRAIASDIIQKTLNSTIPVTQLANAEKSSAEQEQCIHSLESQVEEGRMCFEKLEGLFDSLQGAHELMLHTYFREVLILRQRIRNFETVKHKTRSSPILRAATSVLNRQPTEPRKRNIESAEFSSPQVLGEILSHVGQSFPAEGDLHGDEREQSLPTESSTKKNGRNRKYFISDVSSSSFLAERGMSPIMDPKKEREITAVKPDILKEQQNRIEDSVDAIFDYEKYVEQLNSAGEQLQDCFDKLKYEKDMLAQRFKMERAKWKILSKYLGESGADRIKQLEADLVEERGKSSRLQWGWHLTIKPVKAQLLEQVENIRSQLKCLVDAYNSDMLALHSVVALLDDRTKRLVDFFEAYISDVSVIARNMKKTANAKSRSELLMHQPNKAESVEGFLEKCRKRSVEPTEVVKVLRNNVKSDVFNFQEGWDDWSNHQLASGTRKSISDLLRLADRIRSYRPLGLVADSESAKNVSWKTSGRPKGNPSISWVKTECPEKDQDKDQLSNERMKCLQEAVPGSEGNNSLHDTVNINALRSIVVDGAGMTFEELLQELVRLRMRRACDGARLAVALKNLDLAEPNSDEYGLQEKLIEFYNDRIRNDSKRLEYLLALLKQHKEKYSSLHSDALTSSVCQYPIGGASSDYRVDDGASHAGTAEERARSLGLLTSPYLFDLSNGLPNSDGVFVVPMASPNPEDQYVVFHDEHMPISTFLKGTAGCAGGLMLEEKVRGRGLYSTPTSAVMAYCQGVQIGLPMGRRYGPVYVKHDEDSASYFVADDSGTNLLLDAKKRQANGEASQPPWDGQRVIIPMTQLIYPLPASLFPDRGMGQKPEGRADPGGPYCYYGTPADSLEQSRSPVSPSHGKGGAASLHPVTLIPMTTPVSPEERRITGQGHSAESDLFAPYTPVPLSVSYRHALTGAMFPHPSTAHVFVPPRVCRPPTEEQQMLRIQGFTQSLPNSPPAADPIITTAVEGGRGCGGLLSLSDSVVDSPSAEAVAMSQMEPPSLPASTAFTTALRLAKEQRLARLTATTRDNTAMRDQRRREWVGRIDAAEPASPQKNLQLRLPRLIPMAPSPQQTAQLQRQLKPPQLGKSSSTLYTEG